MKTSLLCPLIALGIVSLAPSSQAQSTNADIQPLLDKVGAAYRNLTTFATTCETLSVNGANQSKVTVKLTLKRPGYLSAEITSTQGVAHVVADGAFAYSDTSGNQKQYLKQPMSKLQDALQALALARGAGVGLLPILLTSPNAEKLIIPGTPKSLVHEPDQTVSGDACDVIRAVIGEGDQQARFEFAFGKQDHLLRKLTVGPNSDTPKPDGAMAIETYSNINLQPTLTADTFKYTPAPGAVATAPPAANVMFDPRLKVGAAPFPLAGNDLSGKPVHLEQFKGKVLMLDFWATWCGPCVGELPNVVAAYSKYHSKGFEIVGISLDQANQRAKVEKFLQDKKMPWQQIYDGKYWEAANAVAYGVRAIPFTLLIGRDGKIAAVGARGEELAPAIEAALGK